MHALIEIHLCIYIGFKIVLVAVCEFDLITLQMSLIYLILISVDISVNVKCLRIVDVFTVFLGNRLST